MNLQELLCGITPEIYENLKRAIELGRWLDGEKISAEQRNLCMQAVIAYEHKHLPPEKHTGYIPPKSHSYCGDDHDHDHDSAEQEQPIKWIE
ncbi:MAG: DUF1315 family protein [Pseudomonadota bacterium]